MAKNVFVILFLTGILLSNNVISKEYDKAFEKKFEQVRHYLGGAQTGPAFLLLEELYQVDSTNNYINYLIGVCYTEQKIISELSIKHLEYATENIMEEYGHIPYTETRAPMFAWYYLTKAYSQNGYCEKAKMARDMFMEIYYEKHDFFIKNINKYLINCSDRTWEIRNKEVKESIVTKDIHYTTQSPLFGVQVGSFTELVPIRNEFDNLKNVEAFMDSSGVIRYIVGHFLFKEQASQLREHILALGYNDAFVVNVNNENRFSREIIIIDNVSFKAKLRGDVQFKIQLGAFKESIPDYLARIYFTVDDIDEFHEKGMTIITAGSYDTYDGAKYRKAELEALKIPKPFIIGFNEGRKLDLQAAIKYRAQLDAEAEEKEAKKIEEQEGSRKKKKIN